MSDETSPCSGRTSQKLPVSCCLHSMASGRQILIFRHDLNFLEVRLRSLAASGYFVIFKTSFQVLPYVCLVLYVSCPLLTDWISSVLSLSRLYSLQVGICLLQDSYRRYVVVFLCHPLALCLQEGFFDQSLTQASMNLT